jgi:hypothetical protein
MCTTAPHKNDFHATADNNARNVLVCIYDPQGVNDGCTGAKDLPPVERMVLRR